VYGEYLGDSASELSVYIPGDQLLSNYTWISPTEFRLSVAELRVKDAWNTGSAIVVRVTVLDRNAPETIVGVVYPSPSIEWIAGPLVAGRPAEVQIYGSNFGDAASAASIDYILIDEGIPCTSPTWKNSTLISCTPSESVTNVAESYNITRCRLQSDVLKFRSKTRSDAMSALLMAPARRLTYALERGSCQLSSAYANSCATAYVGP
jgi:hypothetical protein